MNWDTNTNNNTISREEAGSKIKQKATSEGIEGPFKVFYDGVQVATPDALPMQVDMSKVRVSAVLDQARTTRWESRGMQLVEVPIKR